MNFSEHGRHYFDISVGRWHHRPSGPLASLRMGVDHGGDRGTRTPEFGVGDDNANCPPQILSYKYKNERSLPFKIRQNPFSAWAPPRTPLGELMTPPDPLVG